MTTGKPFKALPSCEELHAAGSKEERRPAAETLARRKGRNIAKAKKKAGR